jgi:ribosomal protein S18 acetylase RimI-like enzyme
MATDIDRKPITIRDAVASDCTTIAAFNSRIAVETEDHELDPGTINRGVAALLGDRSKGRYWLAEDSGKVVGQIMITMEWSDWRDGMLWWIQSVYVHADYRRRGVFSSLYQHVERLARADPEVVGIRLYVEKENLRAQQTYDRLGMSMTDYQVMQVLFSSN